MKPVSTGISCLLIRLGLCFGLSLAGPSLGYSAGGSFTGSSNNYSKYEVESSLIEQWKRWDGKTVNTVHIDGLRTTREKAVFWIIETAPNAVFSAEKLAHDLQVLYNTGVLYNLTAQVHPVESAADKIDVEITLKDKWTLMPVFGLQGGGGALVYGGGLYDNNVAGLFATAQFLGYNYNGIFSYDFNLSQEYLAGSPIMAMVDWSHNVNPTIIHNIDGSSAGEFSWQRQQEEILLGIHRPGKPERIMIVVDYFNDSMVSKNTVNAFVYEGNQYRVAPRAIFGRVNLTDYLEDGTELTFQGSSTNFFGSVTNYQTFEVDFKQVRIISGTDNFAYFLAGSLMTFTPPPYEHQVGGYLNLRGFIDSRQIGPYLLHGNLEYRPLLAKGRWSFFDLDMVALQGTVFADAGSAWGDSTLTGETGSRQINILTSVGAGLRVNFIKFAGAIIRLDFARTLRPDEGWGLSFGVGQFF